MIWVQTLFARKQSPHGPLSSTYLAGHNDNQTLQHRATLAGHGMEWLGEQPCANLSYMGAFLYYPCAYGACPDSRGNYAKQLVLVAKCWLAVNKNSRQFMNHKSLMHVKHRSHLEYHQLKLFELLHGRGMSRMGPLAFWALCLIGLSKRRGSPQLVTIGYC